MLSQLFQSKLRLTPMSTAVAASTFKAASSSSLQQSRLIHITAASHAAVSKAALKARQKKLSSAASSGQKSRKRVKREERSKMLKQLEQDKQKLVDDAMKRMDTPFLKAMLDPSRVFGRRANADLMMASSATTKSETDAGATAGATAGEGSSKMAIIEDIPAPSPPVHAPSHFSNLQPSLKSGLETVTGNLSLFSRGAVQSVHATSSTPSVDSNGEIEHSGLDTKTGRGYQFGLTSSEAEFLFDLAPQTIVQQINPLATGLDVDAIVANGGKLPGSTGELHPSYVQAEQVRKIASLENSNGSEIRKWNVSRAVEMFGMKAGDTGSPEVQAAVFTIRINAMADHLRTNKKDTQSRYRYTLFLQKRKRILKYLKRQSLERYFTTLKMLGLEPEAVENRINPPPKNIEMVH